MRDSFMVTLPEAYLVEIGKISVQWSALESVLDLCTIKLAGMDILDERAAAIFAHMTVPQRLDIFAAIIDNLKTKYPRLEGYQAVLKSVEDAGKARNKIAHAKWLYENGVVTISRLTARRKVSVTMEPITINELRSIGESIGKATIDVYKLVVASPETLGKR